MRFTPAHVDATDNSEERIGVDRHAGRVIDYPSVEQFRRLAQSSPWRWTRPEFERTGANSTSVHAWIRRPGAMRVESTSSDVEIFTSTTPFDGQMIQYSSGPRVPVLGRWPSDVTPNIDADGLVSDLPAASGSLSIDWDDPMYQDYQWVAMLNPRRTHSRSPHDHSSESVPVDISTVTVVEHHGRTAWEAVARTTVDYDPRCDCCPLLSGELEDGSEHWTPGPSMNVRLDVRTGICVYVSAPNEKPEIDVAILAVDEPMEDSLFRR